MSVNYAGEGSTYQVDVDLGHKGCLGRGGGRGTVDVGWAATRNAVVFSSLYCPKDNIEEALLLLLISESMVSPRHH